jgi:hypothetical protein
MKSSRERFVICVDNSDYPASLDVRKVYKVIPDRRGEQAGFIRVVDESGEDYLYPKEYFAPVLLPCGTKRLLRLGQLPPSHRVGLWPPYWRDGDVES